MARATLRPTSGVEEELADWKDSKIASPVGDEVVIMRGTVRPVNARTVGVVIFWGVLVETTTIGFVTKEEKARALLKLLPRRVVLRQPIKPALEGILCE